MGLVPATPEAYELLLKGSIAMSRIERAGVRIDLPYLDKAIIETDKKIAVLEEKLNDAEEMKIWAKHYGNDTNLNSHVQRGRVIFDILGHKRNPFQGNKNNKAAFEHLKLPFIKNVEEVQRLKKAKSTYLLNLKRQCVDGFVHPSINLAGGGQAGEGGGGAESYRSSMNDPNLQNQPIRDKDMARIVRSCVIPRKDHCFIEIDYNTQEVRVSYCYNQDPKLRHDILTGDMHRDRALEIYMLTPEQLGPTDRGNGKMTRYVAKNKFVFAEFYGSDYIQRTPELWDSISIFDLRLSDGVSLYEHLKAKGITKMGACDREIEPRPGTFEHHIKAIERRMWEEEYPAYDAWRNDWWNQYLRDGGINTKTGFCQFGVFRRNQIVCDPIQGSAFHCLLWSCIQIQNEIIRRKMRSRIVLQIHDSMLIDAHKSEVDAIVEMAHRIAVKKVAEHYRWINIPLSIEFERADENWFEKAPMKEMAA